MLIDEFENLFQEATVSLPYKKPMPNNMRSRSGHAPNGADGKLQGQNSGSTGQALSVQENHIRESTKQALKPVK